MCMCAEEGCGLGQHMLGYMQNALLLGPEQPINVIDTLHISDPHISEGLGRRVWPSRDFTCN